MRWVLGFLVLAGLAAAGGLVWFLTGTPPQGFMGTSGRSHVMQGDALVHVDETPTIADATPETSPEGVDDPLLVSRDQALARLQAELNDAQPAPLRSDEERLAAAWEWVRGHRPPDRPYNQLEAKMLALMDVIFDGEERSILWAMNTSLVEVEMVRALDADGDGMVTDMEVAAFSDANVNILNSIDHPYIREKLDVNHDGTVDGTELEKLQSLASMQGAFAGVLERAQLERWDTNRDGVLSASEKQAGEETALTQIKLFEDGHVELVEDAGQIDAGEQQAVKDSIAEKFGEPMLAAMESQQQMLATQALVQSYMDAMRVENLDQNQIRAEMMKSVPAAPAQSQFDLDGDGTLNAEESSAFSQAVSTYQNDMQEWMSRQSAEALRLEFEHAARQSDLNGNGRMESGEWDQRLENLLAARQQRLFLKSYDLDRSGGVDSNELNQFLDWHKSGSLRADANYDGVVDSRDLQTMLENYQRQQ